MTAAGKIFESELVTRELTPKLFEFTQLLLLRAERKDETRHVWSFRHIDGNISSY